MKKQKVKKVKGDVSNFQGCSSPKPPPKITELGDWNCVNGSWVWVPDVG